MLKRSIAIAAVVVACSIAGAQEKPKEANNSFCLVCHANFKSESLAAHHQKHGVGCAKCHGESDLHSADEDGLTPPDILFSKKTVNAACLQCHEEAKLRRMEEHEEVFKKPAAEPKTCTSCHGEHQMANRTRHWDPITRKLIKAEGVRMMEKNSGATNAR